jgi:DNA invertase Pin-like site-specific DNA recombinase
MINGYSRASTDGKIVGGAVLGADRRRIIERTARGRADAKAKAKAKDVQFSRKPKLTPHQWRAAHERVAADETQRSIARSYNVCQTTISHLAV